MSTSQRARSGVPLDQRSALASVPGVPAWGAVAIAGGASFLGFVIDAARGTELTSAFACFYIIGVVAAVVLVRYRGLFTALVQAPLILFVAVPMAYQYFTENPGTGVKDILLNAAIPLVNRFPLMLLGTVLAIGIGGARIFLKRQSTHAPTRSVRERAKQTRERTRDSRAKTKNATVSARSPENRVSGRGAEYDGQPTDGGRRSTDARRQNAENRQNAESGQSRPGTQSGQSRLGTEGRRARRERVEPSYDRPAPDLNRADPYRADPYRPEPVDVERAAVPPRREAPRPPQPRAPRRPDIDPYSAPTSAHVPPHPVPQVRYRDRTEP